MLVIFILNVNTFLLGFNDFLPKKLNSLSKLEFLPNVNSLDFITPSICNNNMLTRFENELFDVREASIYEIQNVVTLRTNVFFPYIIHDKKFQNSIKDKIIKRKINGAIVLVATVKDQLIGTVEISSKDFQYTSMEDIGAKNKLYLADLAVITSARRLGVATKLLQKVESIASKNQFQEIYLHVEKNNEVAQKFYTKNGYTELPKTHYTSSFTETRLSNSPGEYIMFSKQL